MLIVKELLTRHVWVRALPSKDAIHVAREVSCGGGGQLCSAVRMRCAC